jgi:hypothetical protein
MSYERSSYRALLFLHNRITDRTTNILTELECALRFLAVAMATFLKALATRPNA